MAVGKSVSLRARLTFAAVSVVVVAIVAFTIVALGSRIGGSSTMSPEASGAKNASPISSGAIVASQEEAISKAKSMAGTGTFP